MGLQCSSDCSQVIYCSEEGLPPIVIQECSGTARVCDSANKSCTAITCVPPISKSFVCTASWIFPDVFHCDRSYICVTANEPPEIQCSCSSGYYYDTKTAECVQGDSCPRPTDKQYCEHGKLGPEAIEDDPRFYYLCSSIGNVTRVLLFICPDGQLFDNSAKACRDRTLDEGPCSGSVNGSSAQDTLYTVEGTSKQTWHSLKKTCKEYIP